MTNPNKAEEATVLEPCPTCGALPCDQVNRPPSPAPDVEGVVERLEELAKSIAWVIAHADSFLTVVPSHMATTTEAAALLRTQAATLKSASAERDELIRANNANREAHHQQLQSAEERAERAEAERDEAMNRAWRAVDVLGAPDTACTTDDERAYSRAIGDACSEIEKLGGKWS